MFSDVFDVLCSLVGWAVAGVVTMLALVALALAVYDEIAGPQDNPRVDAAYWAERGYNVTGAPSWEGVEL